MIYEFSFTLEKFIGSLSEEAQIIRAWKELVQEAAIIDEHQVLTDLYELMFTSYWPCLIIGCTISKYLEEARHSLKVFEQLCKCVLLNGGAFMREEDEFIIDHIQSMNGKYDMDLLQNNLNRTKHAIAERITKRLLSKSNTTKGTKKGFWTTYPSLFVNSVFE